MNRSNFYAVLRGSALFPHGLSQGHVKGMVALLLLGRYPDLVDRALIWVPIYDLAELYGDTSKERLKTDMITVLGSAPTGPDDRRYQARSPRSCLQNYNGKASLFINVGDLDTQTPKKHGYDTYNAMKAATPSANVILKEWASMGHEINETEALKQLLPEC